MTVIDQEQNHILITDAKCPLTAVQEWELEAMEGPDAQSINTEASVPRVSTSIASPVAPVNTACDGCVFEVWEPPLHLAMAVAKDHGVGIEMKVGLAEGKLRGVSAQGSLVVAGLGIRAAGHLTDEVRRAIADADRVVYLNDPESTLNVERFDAVIRAVNPDIANVEEFDDGSATAATERVIKSRIEEIISFVMLGEKVCIVTYGHPAVSYSLIHRLVRRAAQAKLAVSVLPAISSVDCLFADLLVDPVAHSVQVSGALGFLTQKRDVDPSISLALLTPSFLTEADRTSLVKRLLVAFPGNHGCYLYRASISSKDVTPVIEPIEIARLARQAIKPGFILFIPSISEPDIDKSLLKRFQRRRPVG